MRQPQETGVAFFPRQVLQNRDEGVGNETAIGVRRQVAGFEGHQKRGFVVEDSYVPVHRGLVENGGVTDEVSRVHDLRGRGLLAVHAHLSPKDEARPGFAALVGEAGEKVIQQGGAPETGRHLRLKDGFRGRGRVAGRQREERVGICWSLMPIRRAIVKMRSSR